MDAAFCAKTVRPLLLAALWLFMAGCGDSDNGDQPGTNNGPIEPASCEAVTSHVYDEPLTGGSFACQWCSKQWEWTVPATDEPLFLLVGLTCEALESKAYLEIKDPEGTVLLLREVSLGDDRTDCVLDEHPVTGDYTFRLYGEGEFLGIPNLIERYKGTVSVKIVDGQGDPVGWPPGLPLSRTKGRARTAAPTDRD